MRTNAKKIIRRFALNSARHFSDNPALNHACRKLCNRRRRVPSHHPQQRKFPKVPGCLSGCLQMAKQGFIQLRDLPVGKDPPNDSAVLVTRSPVFPSNRKRGWWREVSTSLHGGSPLAGEAGQKSRRMAESPEGPIPAGCSTAFCRIASIPGPLSASYPIVAGAHTLDLSGTGGTTLLAHILLERCSPGPLERMGQMCSR